MKIKYHNGKICMGRTKIHLDDLQPYKLEFIMLKYSEIIDYLADYLIIDGINYAYLINYFMLYSSSYFSSPGLDTILGYLYVLDKYIKDDIELEISEQFPNCFEECARMVCNQKGYNLKVVKENYPRSKFDFLYNVNFFVKNELRLRLLLRLFIGGVRRLLGKHNHKKVDVLFLSNIRFSTHDEHNNQLFGKLISELDKQNVNCKVLRYEVVEQTSNLFRYIKKYMLEKESYIGDYYSPLHFLRVEQNMNKLSRKWKQLKKECSLKEKFSWKNYNFFKLFEPRLELIFSALAYLAADTCQITKTIKQKEDYSVLVIDHEDNMYGKGFMLNGSNKTLGLAHELIYPGTMSTYIKSEKARNKLLPCWRPLPDIKCVWGEYSKKVLLDSCNYNSENIVVTGNPKFDDLLTKEFNCEGIIKRLSLSRKPKLLFASQMKLESYKWVHEIGKQNPQYEILFKPHPREDEAKVLKFYKGSKYVKVLPKFTPIPELLAISDYVMTFNSTVGFEAMLMDKIVFILNLKKQSFHGLNYVNSGAAIEITNLNQLKQILTTINKKTQIQKTKNFINTIHINDGEATQRVVKQILRLKEMR